MKTKAQRSKELRKLIIEFLSQVPENEAELENESRFDQYMAKRMAILNSDEIPSWDFIAIKQALDCASILGFEV